MLDSFMRPAILRFASDRFMDDYLNVLRADPTKLREYVAQPETWQQPAPTPAPVSLVPTFVSAATARPPLSPRTANPSAPSAFPLKLFQPVHLRYYLVAGSLTCRVVGLPNRTPMPERHERATFVVRRLSSKGGGDEYAFVDKTWKKVSDPRTLYAGEEQTSLPSSVYTDRNNRKRRVFAGLIPVGKREEYMGARLETVPNGNKSTAPADVREILLQIQVTQPITNLLTMAKNTPLIGSPSTTRTIRDQIQQSSWFILLDFVKYLESYLPRLMDAIRGTAGEDGLNERERQLYAYLDQSKFGQSDGTELSLRSALREIAQNANQEKLASATGSYSSSDAAASRWPDFRFLFGDPETGVQALRPGLDLSRLTNLVRAALPLPAPKNLPPLPLVAAPGADPHGVDWFCVRLVFERPDCGPLSPPTVSEPTVAFQLAGFFDGDAPARPLLIPLPVDTTPGGLRKFDKNTGFVMSDVLCGQMKRLEGLSLGDLILSVLPFPFHKDLPAGSDAPCGTAGAPVGQVCSLSIPIVTICAFMLLIMIVKLLDLIFHWMPFFRICFPIPGFKAKAGTS